MVDDLVADYWYGSTLEVNQIYLFSMETWINTFISIIFQQQQRVLYAETTSISVSGGLWER